jgi:hypothetical protein
MVSSHRKVRACTLFGNGKAEHFVTTLGGVWCTSASDQEASSCRTRDWTTTSSSARSRLSRMAFPQASSYRMLGMKLRSVPSIRHHVAHLNTDKIKWQRPFGSSVRTWFGTPRIGGNVDTDKFIQFIQIAQEIHIQNYTGTKLYDKISNDIIAGTLANPYLALVSDYLQPMVIHWAACGVSSPSQRTRSATAECIQAQLGELYYGREGWRWTTLVEQGARLGSILHRPLHYLYELQSGYVS